MPAGLSITRMPSKTAGSFMLRFYLIQQLLDPHFLFERVVVVEGQLRNPSQVVQPLAERATGITGSGSKTLKDFLPIFHATKCADEHAGVPQIGRHLDMSHGDESYSGILDF